MNQVERALLKAIWKKPADLTTRLVYADWLKEHGYDWLEDAVRYWCSVDPEDRELLAESKYRPSDRFVVGYLNRKTIWEMFRRFCTGPTLVDPLFVEAIRHLYRYAKLGRPAKV